MFYFSLSQTNSTWTLKVISLLLLGLLAVNSISVPRAHAEENIPEEPTVEESAPEEAGTESESEETTSEEESSKDTDTDSEGVDTGTTQTSEESESSKSLTEDDESDEESAAKATEESSEDTEAEDGGSEGESGDDGLDPEETDTSEDSEVEGDTVIITGDAEAELNAETEANTNETELTSTSSATGTAAQATGTPGFGFGSDDTGSTTIANTNAATTTASGTVEADTGNNSGRGRTTVIETGDAVAHANVLNVVNTNIFNSDGLVTFINDVLGYTDFKLNNIFESIFGNTNTALSTPACSLSICEDGSVSTSITNSNNAVINNDITVTANTGGNTATGSDALITTGDAYATANVMNVANTNITDSNYLLLSFNNFDDYAGDIVLPNSSFFDEVFQGCSAGNDVSVTNTNEATVSNQATVTSNTGSNIASGDSAVVATGDATANGSITNILNSNLLCGDSFMMVIKVHGDWDGEIQGLPDGMEWQQTARGIEIFNSKTGEALSAFDDFTAENTNNATIHNDVKVFALTGDNKVAGEELGAVSTGDAHASANILNIANTNVVGQNWATLIFNIYGNWSGNLAFGQPDLWVGAKAHAEHNPIMPGDEVEYTFTITNLGDTTAQGVSLASFFDGTQLETNDSTLLSPDYTVRKWLSDIGDILPGATREVRLPARVATALDSGIEEDIPLQVYVSTTQSESDDSNNTDMITITAGNERSKDDTPSLSFPAKIQIEKTASVDSIVPGESVDYTISITNVGGQAYRSVLSDVLENEHGDIISEQYWELDTIFNGETIEISYTIDFGDDASGTYTNSAQLFALSTHRGWKTGQEYYSDIATHELSVASSLPAVLGVATSAATCEQYLTSFMRSGANNDRLDVVRLQLFLNEHLGTSLLAHGTYDNKTEAAVRSFQQRYAKDILSPWGIEEESGIVYLTTRKKVNELYCDNEVAFPLNIAQRTEIESYRARMAFASDNPPPLQKPEEPEMIGSVELPALPPKNEVSLDASPVVPKRQTTTPATADSSVISRITDVVSGWFRGVAEAASL